MLPFATLNLEKTSEKLNVQTPPSRSEIPNMACTLLLSCCASTSVTRLLSLENCRSCCIDRTKT